MEAELRKLEETLLANILDYKERKNTQYVGKEKLFYQHMAEVMVQLQTLSISAYEPLELMCQAFLANVELLHLNYTIVPRAMETIRFLKESMGLKIAVCSNSNTPLKKIKALEQLGKVNIYELFDAFIVSGDVGVRKPNPEILKITLEKFPGVRPHEAFLMGDQIDRDVVCAHLVGVRSIYFGLAPYNPEANFKALAHGHIPDFSVLDFSQLPGIVKVLD